MSRNEQVSAKINEIREATRAALGLGPLKTCPVCCQRADAPFRRHDQSGRIIHGCVDAFHTGHLVTLSSSSAWHNSTGAQEIRRQELARLKEIAGSGKRSCRRG